MAKPSFAPLPCRALADTELSRTDIAVLGAIAAHDRLSASRGTGAGCYVANRSLAAIVGAGQSTVAHAITRLERAGYIERSRMEDDKRRTAFRIIYTEADNHALKRREIGAESDTYSNEIGAQCDTQSAEIGAEADQLSASPETENGPLIYSLKGGNRSRETRKDIPRIGASSAKSACRLACKLLTHDLTETEITGCLAGIEREVSRAGVMSPQVAQALRHIFATSTDNHLVNHADRLLDKFDGWPIGTSTHH